MSSQCQSKSTTLKILPDEKNPNQTKSTEKNNKQTKPQPNEQKTKTKKNQNKTAKQFWYQNLYSMNALMFCYKTGNK